MTISKSNRIRTPVVRLVIALALLPLLARGDDHSDAAAEDLWNTELTYGFAASNDAKGLARGEQVYNQWCAICHADGVGMAGTDSLRRRYKMAEITGVSPVLTERTDLTPEFVIYMVRQGVKSMPYFRKTEISDADLELVGAFLAQKNPNLKAK
ncbi:MAG: cytochrome c [Pseudomonadota bacterium]